MATVIELGTAGPNAQGASCDFGPLGFRWRFRETINSTAAYARMVALAAAGYSGTLSPANGESPKKVIECWIESADGTTATVTSTNNPVATDWDWDAESAQVLLTKHGSFRTEYDALLVADASLAVVWDSVWRGESAIADIGAPALATLSGTYPFLYAMLYKKEGGQTSYFRGEPTLAVVDRYQHTATFELGLGTQNKVYTAALLITLLAARPVNPAPTSISNDITAAGGEWLCYAKSRKTSSDGTRVIAAIYRWSPFWDLVEYPLRA